MEEIIVERVLRVVHYIQPLGSYESIFPILISMKLVEVEDRDGKRYTIDIREGIELEPGNRIIIERAGLLELPQVESENGLKYKIRSIERT